MPCRCRAGVSTSSPKTWLWPKRGEGHGLKASLERTRLVGEVVDRSNATASKNTLRPMPEAPVLKFDTGRPVLYRLVSNHNLYQSLKRCDRPFVARLVLMCIRAFGSKIGSRVDPRFSGAIGERRGPPFKAAPSPSSGGCVRAASLHLGDRRTTYLRSLAEIAPHIRHTETWSKAVNWLGSPSAGRKRQV
jgi:hypothetical protein